MKNDNGKSILDQAAVITWSAILFFLCGMVTSFPALSQTQYPWEKDNAPQKNTQVKKSTHQHASPGHHVDTSRLSKKLVFADFTARVPDNWIAVPAVVDEEMAGNAIMKLSFDGTSICINADKEHFNYPDDNDLKKFQKNLSKNIAHNNPDALRHLNIMGRNTLVIRSFEDDGSTMFYVLPYDGTTCYPIYVVYEQRVNRLTKEVRAILSTLQFNN